MNSGLIINGAPGSGKSSLCRVAQEKLGHVHISTGELLRYNIKNRTELGRIAKKAIVAKSLVPDDIIIQMISERIDQSDCQEKGWMIDGFPRTVDQALALERCKIHPKFYVLLDIPKKEIEYRITGRRFDPETQKIYHSPLAMPVNPEVRERLQKRSDDTYENVAPRIEAYDTYSSSTNAIYASITHHIDGSRKLSEVYQAFSKIVHPMEAESNNNNADTPTDVAMADDEIISDLPPTEEALNEQMEDLMENVDSVSSDEVAKVRGNNGVNDDPMCFRDQLKSGIDVIKHGRRGNPHARTIFCDIDCTRVFWQKVGTKELKPKLNQSLCISTISHVVPGRFTEVLKRSGDTKHADRYFSLIAGERTLDIEVASAEQAQHLIKGFEAFLTQ